MSHFIRYTCKAELLPVVEGALAANGYRLDGSSRGKLSRDSTVVLSSGSTTVLLEQLPESDASEIEVWGAGQSAAVNLLESLPIDLHRSPPLRSAQ